jgi:hypothetical protein
MKLLPTAKTTTTVRWRDTDTTLIIPSARDRRLIAEAMPAPIPPLAPPQNRGSLAPWEPDEHAPEFVPKRDAHARASAVAELAIALDLELDEATTRPATWAECDTADRRRAWITDAIETLESDLTVAEIAHLRDAISSAIMARLPREALGN